MARRVAVIGLGTFGQEVARNLSKLDCEVLAIDVNKDLVQDVTDVVTRAAIADVRDRDALRELGIGQCDAAILSLRSHIDTSVLAVLVLQELGVKTIIAQAVSEDHRRVLTRLGATRVIFPDKDMAERAAQMIVAPDLLDYVRLAPGYGLSEIEVPDPFIGKTIVQANVRQEFGVNIAAVRNRARPGTRPATPGSQARSHKPKTESPRPETPPEERDEIAAGMPFVPAPTYVLREGDILICLGRTTDLRRLADYGGEANE